MSMARQPRKWTMAEDQILKSEVSMQLVAGEVKDWCRIASRLPGRTNKDARKRWHNAVAGGLKKGQWSKAEDTLLITGVEGHGLRWTLVAEIVGSRSADQCAKRWQQSLDPDLDRSEWKAQEDELLVKSVQVFGRRWKIIQETHFPGRSKNCIKNRFTVLLRRSQHQGLAHLSSGRSSPSSNRPQNGFEAEGFVNSDAMEDDDDSSTSVGFELPPRTPCFDRYGSSSQAADDSPMNWTPQESVCASTDNPELGLLASRPENTFGHLDFATTSHWPWHENIANPSLFSGMETVAGYPQSGFGSYNSHQSAYPSINPRAEIMYESSPMITRYPSGGVVDGNSFTCPSSVPDSQNAVKVTLRFNKPDSAMMSNLMKLAMDNEAPFRVERD